MNDVDYSFNAFNSTITKLLDNYAPYKKLNNKEIKIPFKPWITLGIRKSMSRRDIIFRKFKRLNDPVRKSAQFELYRNYRKRINSLIWHSKKNYMRTYFSDNRSNIRKV